MSEQGGVGGQGVFQGFAAGGEGGFDYLLEQVLIGGRQFGKAGQEAQHYGVDFGSRIKIAGTQGKKPLQVKMVAQQDRQNAIVLAAGPGQQALADFLLHHQDQHPDCGFVLQQLKKERRSNLIRQIADNGQGMTGIPAERQKIEVQDIGADNVARWTARPGLPPGGWGAGAGPAPGRQPDACFGLRRRSRPPDPGPISTTVSRAVQIQRGHQTARLVGMQEKILPQMTFSASNYAGGRGFWGR